MKKSTREASIVLGSSLAIAATFVPLPKGSPPEFEKVLDAIVAVSALSAMTAIASTSEE